MNKRLKNTVDIAQDVVIPEANDMVSAFFQDPGPSRILGTLCVLAAIDFDNELEVQRDKIDDVTGDRLLPFELDAFEPPIAQLAPHHLLGFGHPASQCARKLIHSGAPNPLPNGERASYPFPVANLCSNDY